MLFKQIVNLLMICLLTINCLFVMDQFMTEKNVLVKQTLSGTRPPGYPLHGLSSTGSDSPDKGHPGELSSLGFGSGYLQAVSDGSVIVVNGLKQKGGTRNAIV
jgi:hypothetical protein